MALDLPSFSAAAARSAQRPARARASDDELSAELERARSGDEAAFALVYRAVQPGLLRYLSALVGTDAEDVASEAWAEACSGLTRFRGDIDGFRAWIATIGRRRAIDHLRARGRRPVDPVPVEELYGTPGAETTEGSALESITTVAALEAIGSLPRDQAEAVLLRVVLGLDAKAAGRVLGKRAGAVRTAAFRGLRNLAERLETDTDGEPESPPGRHGSNTLPAAVDDEMT